MGSLGRVKFFDWNKKYGFIWDLDRCVDVFVHLSDLCPKRHMGGKKKTLYTGEFVEYNIVPSPSRAGCLKAVEVTGVRGEPLLCENGIITFETYSRHQFSEAPPAPPAPLVEPGDAS